ncbi:ABC transporter ATP-binding protein/permease [Peptoniphilus sp. BV3C26]|uniref:ABC transporter ATP-binding protein/permease n=1 Tax=Peptoniphilus sp. BV3C26 TaxID=1111134 RepID=UPI0003B8ABD8|nr:ABC transporter ATP-binding protein/permease [Peptoniphilus sp. BV3C26]ERT58431.1 ABC transporter, ATP-binding protein [Peptoniphilus sp. BV3C26]
MLNKKLLNEIGREKKSIITLIILKILELLTNIALIFAIGKFIEEIVAGKYEEKIFIIQILLIIIIAKILIIKINSYISYKVSVNIKKSLRQRLFRKIYGFKMEYGEKISISEIINLSVEGIEQLNIFYGELLPQLIFSILGPLILFLIMSLINIKISLIALVFIPFIPIAIMMVQKLAKRVVKSYWKSYTNLGEVFIDFLYGLSTLKIFNTADKYNEKLNKMAEDFRMKTMKLLMVQLNNITVMDLVSYTGSATSIFMTLYYFSKGEINIFTGFAFILLSQEFFTPLRRLGALFHVAMNGISAANSLFEVLDIKETEDGINEITDEEVEISFNNLNFSYDKEKILENLNLKFNKNQITCLVGKSGSGKSTIAKLICGMLKNKEDSIIYNGKTNIKSDSLIENICMIDNSPFIFSQSLKYNLLLANPLAKDEELEESLKIVGLYEYFKNQKGLDTLLESQGNNLSGGQKQRISIARAILRKPKVLILDEAISNIDIESEEIILKVLSEMKKNMNIILITHRLRNTENSDYIYFVQDKKIIEEGSFEEMLNKNNFAKLYKAQMDLEMWGVK